MTDKVPCKECHVLILPATAVSNDGLCWPCKRGGRHKIEAAKQERSRQAERASEARRRHDALLEELSKLSDTEIIARLECVPPLADEDDPIWNRDEYWHETAEVFLVLSDISATRRLRPSIRLLLERACYGDPGEIMRGLRHRLEAIVAPELGCLADICLDLANSPRKGTRLWTISQLAILEDPRAKPLFEFSTQTEPPGISEAAAMGLERLARRNAGSGVD
jgi:hypothetical protein